MCNPIVFMAASAAAAVGSYRSQRKAQKSAERAAREAKEEARAKKTKADLATRDQRMDTLEAQSRGMSRYSAIPGGAFSPRSFFRNL